MKYKKGTFVVVPNLDLLEGKPSEYQVIYMWLCNFADKDGNCFPGRKTLARLAGCNIKTVDKYIKLLIEDGFIAKESRRAAGSSQKLSNFYTLLLIEDEALKIIAENDLKDQVSEVQEMHPDYIKKGARGGVKNGTIGSTENGAGTQPIELNPINTNKSVPSLAEDVPLKKTLPTTRGNNPVSRLISIYSTLFAHLYGFKPKPSIYPQLGGVFKNLLRDYSEIQIAWLLIVFFNWNGMSDKEPKEMEWLTKNSHGIYLFKSGINKYETYVRNVSGFNDEFDDDEKLYVEVGKWISNLPVAVPKILLN